eukprot:jgi/Hompol1/3599/HPOL_006636-RA
MYGTGRSMKTVVAKSLLGQVTVSPLFIGLFLTYTALLDGQDPVMRLQDKFIAINVSSCMIWPFLSIINFKYVPVSGRMVFINMCGICWNTYLSFATNGKNTINVQ